MADVEREGRLGVEIAAVLRVGEEHREPRRRARFHAPCHASAMSANCWAVSISHVVPVQRSRKIAIDASRLARAGGQLPRSTRLMPSFIRSSARAVGIVDLARRAPAAIASARRSSAGGRSPPSPPPYPTRSESARRTRRGSPAASARATWRAAKYPPRIVSTKLKLIDTDGARVDAEERVGGISSACARGSGARASSSSTPWKTGQRSDCHGLSGRRIRSAREHRAELGEALVDVAADEELLGGAPAQLERAARPARPSTAREERARPPRRRARRCRARRRASRGAPAAARSPSPSELERLPVEPRRAVEGERLASPGRPPSPRGRRPARVVARRRGSAPRASPRRRARCLERRREARRWCPVVASGASRATHRLADAVVVGLDLVAPRSLARADEALAAQQAVRRAGSSSPSPAARAAAPRAIGRPGDGDHLEQAARAVGERADARRRASPASEGCAAPRRRRARSARSGRARG